MNPAKPFALPRYWTPDQALTVVDFLDDLREHLWRTYEIELLKAYRNDRADSTVDPDQPFDDDF